MANLRGGRTGLYDPTMSATAEGRHRLALIELLHPDRYKTQRSQHYPFFQALARGEGSEVTWLRTVGQSAPAHVGGNPFIYGLSPHDEAYLLRRLRELSPARVMINERVSDPLWEAICAACPGAELLYNDGAAYKRFFPDLGDQPLEQAVAEPDYDHEPLSDRVWATRPLTPILAGSECLYRRPVGKAACFTDVDLTGCATPDGCSFCGNYRVTPLADPARVIALRQIRAAEKTAPKGFNREYWIQGAALWNELTPFFAAIAEAQIRPTAPTPHASAHLRTPRRPRPAHP